MTTGMAKQPAVRVTPALLRQMAGERSYQRGERYFADGAVRSLRDSAGGVDAKVRGTRTYRVTLRMVDGELGYTCNCPVGWDEAFCKHCVAVGLAWHAGNSDAGGNALSDGSPASAGSAHLSEDELRGHLLGLDKEELVSMLLEHATEDDRLHHRLRLRAARSADVGGLVPSVWKAAIDDATSAHDYIEYRDVYDFARGIEDTIDTLDDMLRSDRMEGAVELVEYGIEALEGCLEAADDSDGYLYGLLGRLQEMHLEACRRKRPDPVDLAARLFEWEMDSGFDTFYRAVFTYADILGKAGRSAYRALAEAEWAKLPVLGPGDDDPNYYGRRSSISSLMKAFAEESGDIEALVAVKSRDLSMPHRFLEIAEIYQQAGDNRLALEWAERGMRAFPDHQHDDQFRRFIADVYQRLGRNDEAVALIWQVFTRHLDIATYLELARFARSIRQWPAWRDKALSLVRGRIAKQQAKSANARSWYYDPLGDHSLLVRIFLHEGDIEHAWLEAEAGGCSSALWLELAERRATSHPKDAVRIYRDHIDFMLRNTGNDVYGKAVGFMAKIQELLVGLDEEADFYDYLSDIRSTHKRKRNLMKMLDSKGW